MEQTTVKNLPKGTLKGLERQAKANGMVFFNGRANTAAYMRKVLIEAAQEKKQ